MVTELILSILTGGEDLIGLSKRSFIMIETEKTAMIWFIVWK